MKSYLWNIFIALTQLLNTLFRGYPDETTSSHLWRLKLKGKALGIYGVAVVDALFWWQPSHCKAAYESERARYQFPPILR